MKFAGNPLRASLSLRCALHRRTPSSAAAALCGLNPGSNLRGRGLLQRLVRPDLGSEAFAPALPSHPIDDDAAVELAAPLGADSVTLQHLRDGLGDAPPSI